MLGLNSVPTTALGNITSPIIGSLLYNPTDEKVYVYTTTGWSATSASETNTSFSQNDSSVTGEITYTNEAGTQTTAQVIAADNDNQLEVGTNGGAYLGPTVYTGSFIITGTGNQIITGLPFEPSSITFVAHANVETLNLDSDNGVGDNNTGLSNSFGTMNGFARNDSGTTTQQVIYVGGSGNSINDISRYASSSNCIGIRYGNQNGVALGRTLASLASFDLNGFTINVSTKADNVVVLYTAYK